jgi:hypothetical protein
MRTGTTSSPCRRQGREAERTRVGGGGVEGGGDDGAAGVQGPSVAADEDAGAPGAEHGVTRQRVAWGVGALAGDAREDGAPAVDGGAAAGARIRSPGRAVRGRGGGVGAAPGDHSAGTGARPRDGVKAPASRSSFGARLMARRRILVPAMGVRFPRPEPRFVLVCRGIVKRGLGCSPKSSPVRAPAEHRGGGSGGGRCCGGGATGGWQ